LLLPWSGFGQESVRRDSVVVTGTYQPVPLEEADRAIRVLDVRESALLSNTFVDLLKLDPSLDLRQRAPNGVQSDLSIRGGTFGQALILLNGIRLNDPQSGHHNMDVPIPLETMDRIEVLRGAGSTFHGSDAVGGVVNFITQPPDQTEVRLRTAVGNWGVNQQRASVTTAFRNVTQQWAFSRDFSTGFQPNRDYRNLSLASVTHAKTGLGFTDLILAHNDRPFGASRFYGNFESWERTKGWLASLRQELGRKNEVSVAYRRHTDLFVLYRDRPEVFTNRHVAESFEGILRRKEPLGQNARLSYGMEAYADSIDSNNLGKHSRVRGAGYMALDVRALHRFSFTAGLRDEVYSRFQHQVSPSLHAGYWLNGYMRLRGGVGRAFRLPSYTDLYYHDPANLGSPDLRPEKAWNFEGGLDWHLGGRLRGEFTVFHRRERDGIDYVRLSDQDIWRATNFHRLIFTGVETSIGARIARRHTVDFSYTALRGGEEARAGILSQYVFNYPQHTGVASWQGRLPGGISARTRVGATQRYARDPYAVWDLFLAYSEGRWHPFFQLTNLTATRYEEIKGLAMPGRGIVFGVEVHAWGAK